MTHDFYLVVSSGCCIRQNKQTPWCLLWKPGKGHSFLPSTLIWGFTLLQHLSSPREPTESPLLLWGLIPLHCLAQRTEQLLACIHSQSVSVQTTPPPHPPGRQLFPCLRKPSRKSGNRKILHKKLPKFLPPTEKVFIWPVRAVHRVERSLSDSSVGLDGQIPVTAKTPSSTYVWQWKKSLWNWGQDPIRYKFGNGHPSNGSAQSFPFWLEVADNTSI